MSKDPEADRILANIDSSEPLDLDGISQLIRHLLAEREAAEERIERLEIRLVEFTIHEFRSMEERLREAETIIRVAIYHATHLSSQEEDGSHWARMPRQWLADARAFLSTGKPSGAKEQT